MQAKKKNLTIREKYFIGGGETKQGALIRYVITWTMLMFVVFINYYDAWCKEYNTTLLALSYKYGFTSRGLLGTIYQGLGEVLGIQYFSYECAVSFMKLSTVFFSVLLLLFFLFCMKKCDEMQTKKIEYLSYFFSIISMTTFSANWNFGRIDLFMLATSLLAVMLILTGKSEWLVIPLSAVGVMFHQGYVLMFLNMILVLLFYKMLSARNNRTRVKYGLILGLSFLCASALFLWFQLFSYSNSAGERFLDEIIINSKALGFNGMYSVPLIEAEVLGIDQSANEVAFRAFNREEMAFYLLFMIPFLVPIVCFLKGMVKQAKGWLNKIKYLAVSFGWLTMLPDFLLKVDYGRWVYAVMAYFFIVIAVLIAWNDEIVVGELNRVFAGFEKRILTMFAFVYMLLFLPFNDVIIVDILNRIHVLIEMILL